MGEKQVTFIGSTSNVKNARIHCVSFASLLAFFRVFLDYVSHTQSGGTYECGGKKTVARSMNGPFSSSTELKLHRRKTFAILIPIIIIFTLIVFEGF